MKNFKEFEKLYEKRHPLNKLQNHIHLILTQRNQNIKSIKNKITLSHTSNQILIHNESLRRIRRSFNLLTQLNKNKLQRIYAKKAMASFNIQKNNLLGLKRIIDGYNYYDFIQKNLILNNIKMNSHNISIKELIILKEIDKEYDLILRIFPNRNQFGCRLNINNSKNIIQLKTFNLFEK